jgi:ABC-2 type transport system permease protein
MNHWLRSYLLLTKWNVLRMRTDLLYFLAIQTVLACGVVVGWSFLIPNLDVESATYLTTGAMTISLILVGMVLAPQIVSYRKKQGVLDYQRSMPVPRLAMLAADASIWIVVAIPGLVVTLIVATIRFGLDVSVSPWLVPTVFLVSAGAAGIGCCIAYAFKPELVGVITNFALITALMFAPVNYPAERLPGWAQSIHEWLPFQYMAQAIRETVAVPPGGIALLPFVVLVIWTVAGLAVTTRVMTRRV